MEESKLAELKMILGALPLEQLDLLQRVLELVGSNDGISASDFCRVYSLVALAGMIRLLKDGGASERCIPTLQ